MRTGELLAEQLAGTRDWTLKLLADLDGDDWYFQPAPGLAHPLWLCGHLAGSQHTLVHVRCLGRGILGDDFLRHFPIGQEVRPAGEHDYPGVAEVRRAMDDVHAATVTAVRGMSDALLAEPAYAADGKSPHPHYRDKAGAIAHCSRHEAFHAGQIATIRRLLGKRFLR
ncbi:MAG: DinB family protein [Planctomycetes bacterium]|nr:DinB family protein [Planctomycetota bacterium]